MKLLAIIVFTTGLSFTAYSQDFVYTPKNPAFGGDTFNYNWLLSSAQAQDTYKDPSTAAASETDALKDFEDNLNRQILYQLSRQLVSNQFGTDGLEAGSYEVGSYQIQISEGPDGITVTIVDGSTGGQTTVLVPQI